jgi:hypothetical protein
MQRSVLSLAALLLALAPFTSAEEPKAASKEEAGKLSTPSKEYKSAAAIDFSSELELAFPGLTTLGGRIEMARRLGDPVGLSLAAKELAVAEKVSDKKASLTAEALAKEAAGLALARDKSRELAAVALLSANAETAKTLTMAARLAAKGEADDTAKIKLGEKGRGIEGRLVVHNHFRHGVRVYVNGNFVGHVHGGGHAHFHVHTHGRETRLRAEGSGREWRQHVDGHHHFYDWTLRSHRR